MIEVKWRNWDFVRGSGINDFWIEDESLPIKVSEIKEIVKKDIIKNQYLFAGDYHQCGDHGVPVVLDDDIPIGALCYSMRRWGAFMAEIWGRNNVMAYMDFYMTSCIPQCFTEKLPESK